MGIYITHIAIDKSMPLEKEHFDHWLKIWHQTVDDLFAGEVAALAKNKAMMLANLINIKVEWARTGKVV